jgi:hypothetical protein
MLYPEQQRPAAGEATGLVNIEKSRAGEFDKPEDTGAKAENQGRKSGHDFSDPPTHPDAIALWPLLYPLYRSLLAARFDLEAWYPRQSNLCGRMASALREQMMDAELGLLNASPEQRVARAARRSA